MNLQSVFLVTTLRRLESDEIYGGYEFGSSRCVGIFNNINEARHVVMNNVADICETIYHYALIEEIEFGLYPTLVSQELYKAVNMTKKGEDGKDYYNFDLTYERIELPDDFQKYCLNIG